MIGLNVFNYFELTGNYASLRLHLKGGEDKADDPRLHAKYMGTVYPHIVDIFRSSNPGWTRTEVYLEFELV